MYHINNQKRIRLTFVDDYFDEKWEEKVIFLYNIDCIKKKFLNDCSPSDPAIPSAYSCVYRI